MANFIYILQLKKLIIANCKNKNSSVLLLIMVEELPQGQISYM